MAIIISQQENTKKRLTNLSRLNRFSASWLLEINISIEKC